MGIYQRGVKNVLTPCYFVISNLGGGGTNVSRFVSYMDLFDSSKLQLLLNYYYVNVKFEKTIPFDLKTLENLQKAGDIIEFLKEARKDFIKNKKRIISSRAFKESVWNPFVMLDSGSGNIFRDIIKNFRKKPNSEMLLKSYSTHIKDYIDFSAKHNFDILIAMDIASKNTQKQGEHEDELYQTQLLFSQDKYNLELLKKTLELMDANKKFMIFAPVHGVDVNGYLDYLKKIISLETTKKKFDGFAIGGLGRISPSKIYILCRVLRSFLSGLGDLRPIHVLGAGSLQNILPISLGGADSCDCHSPWRRASEGKFVIPLLDSSANVVNKNPNYWSYIPIEDFDSKDYICDCEVCKNYTLNELKSLLKEGNESAFFAKLLFFVHNVKQQELAFEVIRQNKVKNFIKDLPNGKYKKELNNLFQLSLTSLKV